MNQHRPSPAVRRKGVQYYLSYLTRCSVTGRLTNRVYLNAEGKPVIAFDADAAKEAKANCR